MTVGYAPWFKWKPPLISDLRELSWVKIARTSSWLILFLSSVHSQRIHDFASLVKMYFHLIHFWKLFFWHWKMQEMRQRGPTIGPVVDQQLLRRNDLLHTLNVSLIVLQARLLSGCIVRLCLILGIMVYEIAPPWPHASTILMIKGLAVNKWFMRTLVAMNEVHVVVEPAFSIGNRQQKFGIRKGCHDFLVKEHVWFIHGCVKSTQGGKRIIQWAIARSIAKKIST